MCISYMSGPGAKLGALCRSTLLVDALRLGLLPNDEFGVLLITPVN
jgi:hypothetical protein